MTRCGWTPASRAYAALCDVHLSLYRRTFAQDAFEAAESACAQALQLGATEWEVHQSRGTLFRLSGQYERSLTELRVAERMQPNAASVHQEIGKTLDRLKSLEAAEAAFRRGIELEPGYWGGYLDLANFFYDNGRYDPAMEQLDTVLRLSPGNMLATSNQGSIYLARGDFAAAVSSYDLARRAHSPPSRSSLTNLGLANYYLGCYAQSAHWQQQAIAVAPSDHRLWGRLAESCRFVTGGRDGAERAWREAIELAEDSVNQGDWETAGLVGIYHAHLGNSGAATRQMEAMNAMNPMPATASYFEAIVAKKTGDEAVVIEKTRQSEAQGFPLPLMRNDPDLHGPRTCGLQTPAPVDDALCANVKSN